MFFSTLFEFFTKHNLSRVIFFFCFIFSFYIKGNACFQEKSIISKKKVSYQSVKKATWYQKKNNLSNIFHFPTIIQRPCVVYTIIIIIYLCMYVYIYMFVFFFVDHNLIYKSIFFYYSELPSVDTIIKTRIYIYTYIKAIKS